MYSNSDITMPKKGKRSASLGIKYKSTKFRKVIPKLPDSHVVKSSETDQPSVVNCGNTLSCRNKDSGKKHDGGYVSEILTDEEDAVSCYNARNMNI